MTTQLTQKSSTEPDSPDHSTHDHSFRRLGLLLFFTLVVFATELIGGHLASSLALVSDAFHMLGDALALSVGAVSLWIARRPKNSHKTFGYSRVETLGALFNSLTIFPLTFYLVYEAVLRFQAPMPVQGGWVTGIAMVGLVTNIVGVTLLHGHHSHSLGMKAAYLHILSDLLGSVGALVSGVVVLATGWLLIDPIVTLFIALLMLNSAFRLLRETLDVLLNAAPEGISIDALRLDIESTEGVTGIHDLHVWALSSHEVAMSAHVRTRADGRAVLPALEHMIQKKHAIGHITIQIEDDNAELLPSCSHCETD